MSELTAATSDWGTFHITGLDTAGHVIVTWWQVTEGWQFHDVTALTTGPSLSGTQLASNFNSSQSVINVVGVDDTGEIRVYWWSIAGFWQVSTPSGGLSASVRPGQPLQIEGFSVTPPDGVGVGRDSVQSISGLDAQGDTVRLWWRADGPDRWTLENLTDLARPL